MEDQSIAPDRYKDAKEYAQGIYSKIGSVWCPQLKAWVIFDRAGFQHLMRRRGIPRPKSEQKRRFALIIHAPAILEDPHANFSYKAKASEKESGEFWIFKQVIDGIVITVVLRRLGNGHIHFFSVYQNKNPS